jgi:hypothetical protein
MCMHGDKAQNERDWVLKEFREGGHPILIATDVASRGLGMSWNPEGRWRGGVSFSSCKLLCCVLARAPPGACRIG